uniref:Uncharacterized protein n=1 Tax=Moschus moschiferus TaxID=68415 RepID=A0A8C6FLT4_MOSMO
GRVASFTSVLPPSPLHIVALVITVGVTWIVVSILLGGLGSGFPRIQQLFTSESPDLASIIGHVHNWVLVLLLLHPFIPSRVTSPLISSSILGTYRPGEFLI